MKAFRGLFPPLITPFHPDGSLNEQGLREHVDFVIANGADGFCGGSSTGEFMNLTREEWERVLAICAGTEQRPRADVGGHGGHVHGGHRREVQVRGKPGL